MNQKSTKAKEEYEITLFGFHVTELQKSQRTLIQEHTRTLVEELGESILTAARDVTTDASGTQFHASYPIITESIMASSASTLKRMDKLIDDTFSIPDRSVLPEHQLIAKHAVSADEEAGLQSNFVQLSKDLKERVQYINTLDAELKIHQLLEIDIERQTAIMDRVEELLLTDTGAVEARQLMELLNASNGDVSPALHSKSYGCS